MCSPRSSAGRLPSSPRRNCSIYTPIVTRRSASSAIVKQHPTTFIMGIGGKLSDGKPHDGRAPDYDDWQINGDILFYNPLLDCAFEISSMGVRVDAVTLDKQLSLSGCDNRTQRCRSTRCCWKTSFRRRSVVVSGSPVYACCCSTKHTSERCRALSGMQKQWHSASMPA